MSRILSSYFLLILSTTVLGQAQSNAWKQLLSEPVEDGTYFLVNTADLDEDRLQVVRRLDDQNLIVRIKEGASSAGLKAINNDWKLNLNSARNRGDFYVKTVKDLSNSELGNLNVVRRFKNGYLVQGRLSGVTKLKENPKVIHISDESSTPRTEARVIDMNINPNRVNKVHHNYPDLDGSDMIVSIQENQFRENDIDVQGRIVESSMVSPLTDNHATEMATVIAGAGNSFLTGKGVAKKARITSSDFSDVLPDDDFDYQALGIQVQNHSYGTEIESFYGVQAQAFDQSAFDNPTLQHVFSSGNQGFEVAQDGTYEELEGFGNLTGNFKMAKNALVVGSVDTVGTTVSFVSNGPAYDGRIKPELVAYSVVGSSNSAALVSGVSTLLQSRYQTTIGEEMPSSLLRSLLISGAEDVGASGLDFKTGYGSVDSSRSLEILDQGQFHLGTVLEGETVSVPLTLPENVINLKVTLSWTDPASDVASFKALVNDLDLRVVQSSGQVLPWVLNTSPTIEELTEPATRSVDRLNNNELVTIDNPDTDLTIEVHGFDVSGSQDFAISYQYELVDTFQWDYPTGSDNMPYNGESGSYFRWKSTLQDSEGRLEYSIDDGLSWEVLSDQVDLNVGRWRWNAPFKLDTEARARMVTATEIYETEVFTISNPIDVSVGFICADSARLQWENLSRAAEYEIYNMGEENLELFATTSDTALIIPDLNVVGDTRFAVVPILESGKKLIPSLTLDITQQAIECFVFSFFQEVELDQGIYLNLTLGTSYGIERITFERESPSGIVEVTSIDAPTTSNFRILDPTPDQGNNTHRVIIDFVNGERIEQEASNTYYLTETPLILFPNPSLVGEGFTVLTKDLVSESPRFTVLDARGLVVFESTVLSTQFSVPTGALEPGTYFYKLVDGAASYTGRLLVR